MVFYEENNDIFKIKVTPLNYTRRLRQLFNWQFIFLFVITITTSLIYSSDKAMYTKCILPSLLLLFYLYYALITIKEAQNYIIEIEIDTRKKQFKITYLNKKDMSEMIIFNTDDLKLKITRNGIGFNSIRSWKIDFIVNKKVLFTQYAISKDWSPDNFLKLVKKVDLLKMGNISDWGL